MPRQSPPALVRALKLMNWLDGIEPMSAKVARVAARHNISRRTVYKVLRRHGVALPVDGHRWTPEQDAALLAYASQANGPVSVTQAAKAVGRSIASVHTHAPRLGVALKPKRTLGEATEATLRRLVKDGRLTVTLVEAAKRVGCTPSGVHKWARRNAVALRKYRPWTLAMDKRLLALHADGVTALQAAKILGTSDTTLKRHERRHGITFKRLRKR